MDEQRAHTANVLGALALVVTDRAGEATAAAAGHSASAAAALSALYHVRERPTIDALRRALGLTSSGTVRLVDRLAESGLVTREQGPDGRSTSITLTPAGRQAAQQVTEARAGVLESALRRLSDQDIATLDRLLGGVLTGFMRGPDATKWICRLCDLGTCDAAEQGCPIANVTGRPRRESPRP